MRLAIFCHSLLSDWNHDSAHFLRGVATELARRGHDVVAFEPRSAWSVENLVRDHGQDALLRVKSAYPTLRSIRYDLAELDLDAALAGVDLVLVHEWNEPDVVAALGRWRTRSGSGVRLLFHDTHHRSVTDPAAMARYALEAYDGVLAFGAAVRNVYQRRGWGNRVWVWHEAADARIFRPRTAPEAGDLVWVGNWDDEERSHELGELLIEPVRALGLRASVYGVRYPAEAREVLARSGIDHRGWIPNFEVPDAFARFRLTIHVPRRPYVESLPGVPTIRVFEALACGIPLVSAPWRDDEDLFSPGEDFLVAKDGRAMRAHLRALVADGAMRSELARRGRATILAHHTCSHRVDELLAIAISLGLDVSAGTGRPAVPAIREATIPGGAS